METPQIAIRTASPDDFIALWSLAALDSALVPSDPLLVAEADGRVVAAMSLQSGETIADPFRRTAEAVALLRLRASQFAGEPSRSSSLLRRLRGRPAPVAVTQ
jgi:hypothetical protein